LWRSPKGSFHFTSLTLVYFVLIVVFCVLFVFVLCVVLFVTSLTQSKLLNSLITLGTMLSLSVGVSIGFELAKSFKIFEIVQVPIAIPSGRLY